MLPTKNLVRTNFIDGIKFNPEQIGLSDKYFNSKISLVNSYGVGRGILVGFKDSLRLVIEDGVLILKKGVAIDSEGNIIFIEKDEVVLKDISTNKYDDRRNIYIYLSYEDRMEDLASSKNDKNVKIYYKIVQSHQIIIGEKRVGDSNLIELGRVYIHYKTSTKIKMPLNPFNAGDNEINIGYAPKIVGENSFLALKDRFFISNILNKYGSFLHEFGFRKSIFSMSTVSSFALNLSFYIKNRNSISTWEIYDGLYTLLELTKKIKIEREEIVNTAFWKNIVRLQDIFSFKDSVKIDYYNLYLDNEESFFSKILLHLINATIFDGDWKNILKERDIKEKVKDYIIVGHNPKCDIVVDGEDIADKHAKIYRYKNGYFIEDLENTSGVYVNSERVDRGVKKFIRKQDYVALGKNGKVLNLQNIQL